jgi:hypothetical protein
MATTTNYSWTTPDDTDLVKDGAAAIRTLGSSIDTTTKNLNPSTTLGDIEYRSSTANTNTRLGIGTTGQVLTVAGGVPSWAAPVAGKVLQVVQATTSTPVTVASTTYTDSGITASITPSSTNSKILVIVNQEFLITRNNGSALANARLLRGSTSIYGDSAAKEGFSVQSDSSYMNTWTRYPITYLDSPATTSSVTYKTQVAVDSTASSQVVVAQANNTDSSIILMEIGA